MRLNAIRLVNKRNSCNEQKSTKPNRFFADNLKNYYDVLY